MKSVLYHLVVEVEDKEVEVLSKLKYMYATKTRDTRIVLWTFRYITKIYCCGFRLSHHNFNQLEHKDMTIWSDL